jgi:hypothetical protein
VEEKVRHLHLLCCNLPILRNMKNPDAVMPKENHTFEVHVETQMAAVSNITNIVVFHFIA